MILRVSRSNPTIRRGVEDCQGVLIDVDDFDDTHDAWESSVYL